MSAAYPPRQAPIANGVWPPTAIVFAQPERSESIGGRPGQEPRIVGEGRERITDHARRLRRAPRAGARPAAPRRAPRLDRADGRHADRRALRRPELGLRAQARRSPLPRLQGAGRRRAAAVAQPAEPEPTLPRAGGRARASARRGARRRRRGRGGGGRRPGLQPAGARRARADRRVPLPVRPGSSRRIRHAPAPAEGAQGAAPPRRCLRGPAAAHAAPQPGRPGAVSRRMSQGLGGADREAGGQPVRRKALARLAQAQVRQRAGARDRRLHRAARDARGTGRSAARLLRARPPALRGQGWHGLRPRDTARSGETTRAAAPARLAVRRRRGTGPRHQLGRAAAGGSDRGQRMDPRRSPAPSALPRPARGQGPARRRAREGAPRVTERIRAGRRAIEISHADRVLFPRAGLTKLDLARHYDRVGSAMVPHVRDRPLALDAYPEGVRGGGYLIKQIPAHFPDWIARATVRKRGGEVTHVLANDRATLSYLAGQNAITLHAWPSRADRPNHPDRLIFDLDPSRERFADVRAAARALGDMLRDLGLEPFAMTTGSRGLHVVVPLRRREPFDTVRAFAREVAGTLVAGEPTRLTTAHRKADRGKRIF